MKLCKLVFVLGTPQGLVQTLFLDIKKGQLGIAAFIFLLICARTVSLEGYPQCRLEVLVMNLCYIWEQ